VTENICKKYRVDFNNGQKTMTIKLDEEGIHLIDNYQWKEDDGPPSTWIRYSSLNDLIKLLKKIEGEPACFSHINVDV
jgi:hypothetical protein